MRYEPFDVRLFETNRERLRKQLLPGSLAIVNANDVLPTTTDGSLPFYPNSDLFYLSGIEQEQTVLLIAPDAQDESLREVLFLREPTEQTRLWEGHKFSKEEAQRISGIKTVKWLGQFGTIWHHLMCETDNVYLNSNEHVRASIEVATRDTRFVQECQSRYPLHQYHRLGRILALLRGVKSDLELDRLRAAISITAAGFRRVLQFVRPGVNEAEVEAEFAHEFIRRKAKFSYAPIVASGENACVLHYIDNDQECKDGELLLLDVAAAYANYNADITRAIPVNGRFTDRQRQVYNAVLRVMRASVARATVGKLARDWTREAQQQMNEELLDLGLIGREDIEKHTPQEPACRKYFMHGLGHSLGLGVHDYGVTTQPFAAGWVLTVEPGIYIPDEGFAVRLETDILLTENGPIDLGAEIPVEADAIEAAMRTGAA
jgi:Xaa-Pro aminopeptidase